MKYSKTLRRRTILQILKLPARNSPAHTKGKCMYYSPAKMTINHVRHRAVVLPLWRETMVQVTRIVCLQRRLHSVYLAAKQSLFSLADSVDLELTYLFCYKPMVFEKIMFTFHALKPTRETMKALSVCCFLRKTVCKSRFNNSDCSLFMKGLLFSD